MVVASLVADPCGGGILRRTVPVVDLSGGREEASNGIVGACEELGFFKVVNHGVPGRVVAEMESSGEAFFSLPAEEKRRSGPPDPLGYGVRSIGFSGDTGELEYLLLHTNPNSVRQRARTICREDPSKFSDVVNDYVHSLRELACGILDMLGEGLGLVGDKRSLSRLLRDSDSDSLVRLNHYPPCHNSIGGGEDDDENGDKICDKGGMCNGRIGFGEHSDPQIISILRSNDVEGLQILSSSSAGDDVWVPIAPDPSAFYVQVGDTLEALTNGRLVSVRHRAISNSDRTRLSMVYFGAPPLGARISPLPGTVVRGAPRRYRSFTWAEYKKVMYALRLSHNRLELFRMKDGQESSSDDDHHHHHDPDDEDMKKR